MNISDKHTEKLWNEISKLKSIENKTTSPTSDFYYPSSSGNSASTTTTSGNLRSNSIEIQKLQMKYTCDLTINNNKRQINNNDIGCNTKKARF